VSRAWLRFDGRADHQFKQPRKLNLVGAHSRIVLNQLSWKWSPRQISGTLRHIWSNVRSLHVSHEAIYAQARGALRRQIISSLSQARSTRMPRSRGNDRRGQIATAKLNAIATPLRQRLTYD